MPVVHVRANRVDGERAAPTLALIAEAVADAVPCDVDGVWCTFTAVDVQTMGLGVRDHEGRIVYVDVWIRPRDRDDRAASRALSAACEAAAAGFDVPIEDIWGSLRLVEPQQVFAGGSLIEG